MAVVRLEVQRCEPYEGGKAFGAVGPYERLEGVAHYAVDPADPANSGIVDLGAAARGSDGFVHFSGEVSLLRPVEAARANGLVLLDAPNRGRRVTPGIVNRAPVVLPPNDDIGAGDGFLQRHGWCLAWGAWQWDVPPGPGRLTFTAPVARSGNGSGPQLQGFMQLRIQVSSPTSDLALTDPHVGPLGAHAPIPTIDVDDPDAVLYRAASANADPVALPRSTWRFARDGGVPGGRGGGPVADPGRVWLDGGFEPGAVYDLVYRVATSPVVGAGMLALRDLGAFLRSDRPDNPLAGAARQTIVTGMSQNSRLLRTALGLGLDRTEDGTVAFDGVLALVGGGRRGEFNHRFAQPSVQPTPSFGHLFPFADLAQTDPRTGRTAGLLEPQAGRPGPPKVVFVDTAAEYWRGDASLAHTSVVDGGDVADAPFVRRYLFASAQHGPGYLPLGRQTAQDTMGANCLNVVDYTPLYRAVLANLAAWAADGVEPPPSEVPRAADRSAAERADVLAQLASIAAIALPAAEELYSMCPLDLGPHATDGVGTYPARVSGDPYPCVVSAVDSDGNEVAGIRMPDVAVPVATHLGFNPRHPSTGGAGQLLQYTGSTVPFARTAAERAKRGDPRPSIDERYRDLDDYLDRVRTAAEALVARRHLLAEDVELCVRIGKAGYNACRAVGLDA